MKKILNIYNKITWDEILGSVYTCEEFVHVRFTTRKQSQPFTYSEYVERVKTQTKNWYYFKKAF